MGRRALHVTRVAGDEPAVVANATFHVWCATAAAGGAATITLAYTNPTGVAAAVSVADVADAPRVEYVLTATAMPAPPGGAAPPASLTNDTAYLNGVLLTVGADGVLPAYPIPGRSVAAGGAAFVAPPWSLGFVTYVGANAPACA